MNTTVREMDLIASLVAEMPRSPRQLNHLQESDAELVHLPARSGDVLAATTDTIAEEIGSGLYADLELAGWMTVMASMSDLSAVGAEPIGLLIAETLPASLSSTEHKRLQTGIRKALQACGTALLGGDTNAGASLSLTGTALGIMPLETAFHRSGARPEDILFLSAPCGAGNAFGFSMLRGNRSFPFRPLARIREGIHLRGYATSCMDTSDGLLSTIDQITRVNEIGCLIDARPADIIDAPSAALFAAVGLTPWLLLAGIHGEFELAFTVPPDRVDAFAAHASSVGWKPVRAGVMTQNPGVRISTGTAESLLDTTHLRNLWDDAGHDPQSYMKSLLDWCSMSGLHDAVLTNP